MKLLKESMMKRNMVILAVVFGLMSIQISAQEGFSFEEMQEYNQWKNKFDTRADWVEMEFNENFDYREHKIFVVDIEQHGDVPYISWWGTPNDDFMVRFQYEPANKTYTVVLKVKPLVKCSATLANFTEKDIGID
jgi:hypothetical protein